MRRRALSDAERLAWLRLARTSNVGPVTFAALIARCGDAQSALEALPRLAERGGRAKPLRTPPKSAAEQEIEALEKAGGRLIASVEPEFPRALAAIDPPPPVISVLGSVPLLSKPCVAIVGARNASAAGLRMAASLAREIGEAGYTVVSGMARGVDGAAHEAALESGTAAVLAGGPDHVYPAEHEALYGALVRQGAVISENRLGYRATARDFPRRNRLVSGLSLGVVVVEAAHRSGTLITARLAGEQGREVMAVPGSPLDPRAKGTNRLLRDGAALIESGEDVLEVLQSARPQHADEGEERWEDGPAAAEAVDREADSARAAVLDLLSPTPVSRDELARLSGHRPAAVLAALVELELAGRAELLPGGAAVRTYSDDKG